MAPQNNITTISFAFDYTHIPYFLISFVGVTSNALLLVAFMKDPLKCFRNKGTYHVINLSVSDLLTSLYAIPFHSDAVIIRGLDWAKLLSYTFGIASFISIASISIDRFLLVAYPLKHRQLLTGKVMILWLSGIWLSSVALPMLGLFYSHRINKLALNSFSTSFILLSVMMYVITYSKLRKHSKNIAQQNSTESRAQEMRTLKEKKFVKTIVLIAGIAFFCLVPSLIYFQLKNSSHFSKNNLETVVPHEIFAQIFFVNFAVNPMIYVLRLPNYRKTFYLVYCKIGS